MALVNVCNMVVLDNPTNFSNPFQFEITFECLQELEDDLEWKVLYVGSAESSSHDQVLDEVMVGPVPVGLNKFVLQADAPDPNSIPRDNLLGVTVVLVTCCYRDQEFVRIGYYVNNEYEGWNNNNNSEEGEQQQQQPPLPDPLDLSKMVRTILADKPRVTRFPISWSGRQTTIDDDDNENVAATPPEDMEATPAKESGTMHVVSPPLQEEVPMQM